MSFGIPALATPLDRNRFMVMSEMYDKRFCTETTAALDQSHVSDDSRNKIYFKIHAKTSLQQTLQYKDIKSILALVV